MDAEIPWDDVDDIQLDTKNLPPLNDISTANAHLPDIDLLDLFSFDHASGATVNPSPAANPTAATATATVAVRSPSPVSQPSSQTPSEGDGSHSHTTLIGDDDHGDQLYIHHLHKPRLSTPPPSLSPVTSSSPAPSSPSGVSSSTVSDSDSNSNAVVSNVLLPCLPASTEQVHSQRLHHQYQQHSQPQSTPPPKSRKKKKAANNKTVVTSSPSRSVNTLSHNKVAGQTHAHDDEDTAHKSAPLSDQSQVVLELSTRLNSATAEATALRKRVASLTADNRKLRAALDHANARLVAVAQAATATTTATATTNTTATATTAAMAVPANASGVLPMQPQIQQQQQPAQQPVMLGLAHITSDVASRLSGALTISDVNHQYVQQQALMTDATHHAAPAPASRKKRKRMGAAATTMACVMFMWGALVGSPGWLSSSSSASRTQAALPALWQDGPNGGSGTAPAAVSGEGWPAPPANCIRVLEQLPDGDSSSGSEGASSNSGRWVKKAKTNRLLVVGKRKEEDEEDEEEYYNNNVVVAKDEHRLVAPHNDDEADSKDTANLVARKEDVDSAVPRYSYVLCRDTVSAMDNVKACASRMRAGQACGEPHTISLILPAAAAGLDSDTGLSSVDDVNQTGLAEVQCSITSVARIPMPTASDGKAGGKHAHHQGHGQGQAHADSALYGKVIATVPETGTVVTDA